MVFSIVFDTVLRPIFFHGNGKILTENLTILNSFHRIYLVQTLAFLANALCQLVLMKNKYSETIGNGFSHFKLIIIIIIFRKNNIKNNNKKALANRG